MRSPEAYVTTANSRSAHETHRWFRMYRTVLNHLSSSNARRVRLKRPLTGVQLTGFLLTGALLTGVKLTGALLTGVQLTGVSLAGTSLTGVSLTG